MKIIIKNHYSGRVENIEGDDSSVRQQLEKRFPHIIGMETMPIVNLVRYLNGMQAYSVTLDADTEELDNLLAFMESDVDSPHVADEGEEQELPYGIVAEDKLPAGLEDYWLPEDEDDDY